MRKEQFKMYILYDPFTILLHKTNHTRKDKLVIPARRGRHYNLYTVYN